jgi:MAF protein
MTDNFKFVLASSSPRRRELLSLTEIAFERATPQADESRLPGEPPSEYVTRLSQLKARQAAQSIDPPALVLAADTIVALGEDILGKPRDPDQARAMLTRLRGRAHMVYSAITLLETSTGRAVTDLAATQVPMRAYSDAEIEAYIASGDPFDKAGAYAIQHRGFNPVAEMTGCFASVMGLPLCHLVRSLRALDYPPGDLPQRVPSACQSHLDYECPVSVAVLEGAPVGHSPPSGL